MSKVLFDNDLVYLAKRCEMNKNNFYLKILLLMLFMLLSIHDNAVSKSKGLSENKLLGIIAIVNGSNIELEGYCIYVKNGKEIKVRLKKNNAWGWNFRGDYVKEVKIRKISGDASFRLFIMEGDNSASGKTVFESDVIRSGKEVIYKRKVN